MNGTSQGPTATAVADPGRARPAVTERNQSGPTGPLAQYAADYRAVVIGLNFEPSEKIDWPH